MLHKSGNVAAVSEAWLVAVAELVLHTFYNVVLWVAVGKAVGHKHIKHIGNVKALAFFATHSAVEQGIFHRCLLFSDLEVNVHSTCLCIFQVKVDEQIVRRIKSNERVDACIRIINRYFGVADIVAVSH